ncbi:MAG: PVC-type heme-binding CxxCH protein [Bacteroidota bacterium]
MKIIQPCAIILLLLCAACSRSNKPFLEEGDHLVILGNTFAEDFMRHNFFETLLYQNYPDLQIRVRNLGWSADEVGLRPRPLNFPDLEFHLKECKADAMLLCFGLNESYQGREGLAKFEAELLDFVVSLQTQQFNGETAPKIALLSPLAYEQVNQHMPEPEGINSNLVMYTDVMKKVAKELDIVFVDLFHPFQNMLEKEKKELTTNGIHLSETGRIRVAELLAKKLGFPKTKYGREERSAELRELIAEKNKYFFYSYRPSNSEYLVGRRRTWPGGQTLRAETDEIGRIVDRLDRLLWTFSNSEREQLTRSLHEIVDFEEQAAGIMTPQDDFLPDMSSFVLKEGFDIELYASEREFPIGNPVTMTFDAKGRMWLTTMPAYPHFLPGQVPNDKIVILEDEDGDGKPDRHTIFADSLYIPLGLELGHQGAYVTQAPDLLFLQDTTGDDVADVRQSVLHGFGTEDAHHSLGNFSWAPNGKLIFQMGTFLHSQVETPHGPMRGMYGTTWQYDPLSMELFNYISYPYANPWRNVFNQYGDHLIADASTGRCYYATPLNVAIDYPKKHSSRRGFLTAEYTPKTCGIEIVSSQNFPADFQGDILLNTFVGFQGIRHHALVRDGSGFKAIEKPPLLQSKDPNFRPVDLKFGPDGALYVLDWFSPIVQHGEQGFREALRDHVHGRVWKITYQGRQLTPVPDLSTLGVVDLLKKLKTSELRERARIRVRLGDFPRQLLLDEVDKLLENPAWSGPSEEQNRLELLWLYERHHAPKPSLLQELLSSADDNIRTAATRVLLHWADKMDESLELLTQLSQDPSPKVRLEAVAALSHVPSEESVSALLEVLNLPLDQHLTYALTESFVHLQPIWTSMFERNPDFLVNKEDKADFIFQSMLDSSLLKFPGFLEEDPHWRLEGNRWPDIEILERLATSKAYASYIHRQRKDRQEAFATGDQNGRVRIVLRTLPGQMLYDHDTLRLKAGSQVELVFENNDNMAHNVVFVESGTESTVGTLADEMATEADAYERQFIPDVEGIMFYTPLVEGGDRYTLPFTAPKKRGNYPYICTFPGHWRIMKGTLVVM